MSVEPRKPARLDPLAERILSELSRDRAAAEIVLGGYLALQHYSDYRRTHDIDAWWRRGPTPDAETAIREVMKRIAAEERSELKERRFGETISFELFRAGRKNFSFQIAARSVELEPPLTSAWPPIGLETLNDNIGAKMNALVDRGSPRDFADIYHVAAAGLVNAAECWRLWERKNPGESIEPAKRKVLHHLTALATRRPLESIANAAERRQAGQTRDWYRREFVKAI